jgi:hypothetical protein
MKLKAWLKDGNQFEFADIDYFRIVRNVPAESAPWDFPVDGRVVVVNQETLALLLIEGKPE